MSMPQEGWITWELAKDRYKVTRYELEMLSILIPAICDNENMYVMDIWNRKGL